MKKDGFPFDEDKRSDGNSDVAQVVWNDGTRNYNESLFRINDKTEAALAIMWIPIKADGYFA